PNMLLDDDAYHAFAKDAYTNTVAAPGDHVIRSGQVIDRVPFAQRPVTTQAGATSTIFDPNTGQFATAPPGTPDGSPPGLGTGGPLTVQRLLPLIRQQENAGQYTGSNSVGAMGAYQLMPTDAQRAAQKAGMPYRPDMLTTDTPQNRAY